MPLYFYQDSCYTIHHSVDESPRSSAFTMHAHPGCEVYLFLSGRGYYTVEGHHYPLTPDTLLLMRAGEAHTLHIFPDQPYERVAVHFPLRLLDPEPPALSCLFTDHPLGQGNCYPPDEGHVFLRECLLRLCSDRVGLLPDADMTAHVRAYLLPVLWELAHRRAQLHPAGSATDTQGTVSGAPAPNPLASALIAYVNGHLTDDFDMEDLSKHFFFSPSHLNKVFRSATGSSLWDYVLVKRLLCARAMIQSGQPVTLSAIRSGFSDYSSFYRQYVRRFGLSPARDKGSAE